MKVALLLLAAAVGAASCAENDLELSVTQMEAVTVAGGCVAMAAATGVGRVRGLLDVAQVTTSGYIAVPVVRNNLPTNIVGSGPERNVIQLLGANVTLLQPGGAPLAVPAGMQKFFYPAAAGQVGPTMTASMFVEVLPKSVVQSLAGSIPASGLLTVIAEVRPVGMRANDQIIGGPIDYPIDLCVGCLRTTQPCPLPMGTVAKTGGCFPQQDDLTQCCTDSTGASFCGLSAPVKTM